MKEVARLARRPGAGPGMEEEGVLGGDERKKRGGELFCFILRYALLHRRSSALSLRNDLTKLKEGRG